MPNPDSRRCEARLRNGEWCQNLKAAAKAKVSTRCHIEEHAVGGELDQLWAAAGARRSDAGNFIDGAVTLPALEGEVEAPSEDALGALVRKFPRFLTRRFATAWDGRTNVQVTFAGSDEGRQAFIDALSANGLEPDADSSTVAITVEGYDAFIDALARVDGDERLGTHGSWLRVVGAGPRSEMRLKPKKVAQEFSVKALDGSHGPRRRITLDCGHTASLDATGAPLAVGDEMSCESRCDGAGRHARHIARIDPEDIWVKIDGGKDSVAPLWDALLAEGFVHSYHRAQDPVWVREERKEEFRQLIAAAVNALEGDALRLYLEDKSLEAKARLGDIERSTGMDPGVPWAGRLPGGGYRGATPELDGTVVTAAERLVDEYRAPIEIRFNSDRRSGGAFLPNGVGVGARLKLTRAEWEENCRRYDWYAEDVPAPEGEGGGLEVDVYAPGGTLVHPSLIDPGLGYASRSFDSVDQALDWVKTNTRT